MDTAVTDYYLGFTATTTTTATATVDEVLELRIRALDPHPGISRPFGTGGRRAICSCPLQAEQCLDGSGATSFVSSYVYWTIRLW